jgi:hypothetical protein
MVLIQICGARSLVLVDARYRLGDYGSMRLRIQYRLDPDSFCSLDGLLVVVAVVVHGRRLCLAGERDVGRY